jgi:1,4-alpha-glucan branching enzyme
VLRPLLDGGAVELLGGPVTHPILPLLPAEVASFALYTGLDDAALRVGRRPAGIWLPECAWSPELAPVLTGAGVRHFLVDGPTVTAAGGSTDRPWRVAGSDLVAVARDLALTDLVWSSRSGFPRGADYRDFYDVHPTGLRPSRVTDPARPQKQRYRPEAAEAAARRDAATFVVAVRDRLSALRAHGPAPVAVVAWDTELFGHWWHEGPSFLEHVLRMLPEAGVRLATLGQVAQRATETLDLPAGSWGAGKDLRLWAGSAVADLAADGRAVADRLLDVVRRCAGPASARRTDLDDLAREALLVLSSDWAFMVSRDSAAGYARERHDGHVVRFHALADDIEGSGAHPGPSMDGALASHLDARLLFAANGRA